VARLAPNPPRLKSSCARPKDRRRRRYHRRPSRPPPPARARRCIPAPPRSPCEFPSPPAPPSHGCLYSTSTPSPRVRHSFVAAARCPCRFQAPAAGLPSTLFPVAVLSPPHRLRLDLTTHLCATHAGELKKMTGNLHPGLSMLEIR
jgi:hypothetical protein